MEKAKQTFENETTGLKIQYLKDGRIAIIFDPKIDHGTSGRGRSLIIGSTSGFKNIPYLDESNDEQTVFINMFVGKSREKNVN